MSTPLRCLIVEDSPDDSALLLRELRRGGYEVTSVRVETAETMRAALTRQPWDIVVSDYSMPHFSGLAALELLKASGRDLPFILVSGTVGEELAVEALKAGANDYLMKGKLARLRHAVARALREVAERRERREAAEALQFKNTLLSTQQETTIEGILVVDEKSRVVSCNRRFVEIFGIPAKFIEEKIDEPILQFVTAQLADPAAFTERVRYLYEHRQETSQDEIALKDGRALERYSAPMFGAENRYYGRVWYFRDITERKRSEESLRLNNAALTAAANSIVITDRDGAIIWANPAFTGLTGYTLAEANGKNPRDLIKSGRHENAFYRQMWETILAGGVWRGELVNRRKDGSYYPEEMTITPVRASGGEITHFIAIKQDLTERKLAEKTLHESEGRLRTLVQTIPDLVWLKDVNGVFLSCNAAFARMFGSTEAAIVGRTDFDFVGRSMADSFRAHDQAAMAAGRPTANEEWLTFAGDGYRGLFQTIKTPVRDADGTLTGVLGVARDITSRQRAEEALRQSEERYRLMFESNPLPMWLYDLETLRFLAVNESAVRHYGYTHEEFLGMTIKQIRPAEDVPALLQSIADDQSKQLAMSQWRHRRKDGTTIHVEVFSRPLVFGGRSARLVLANDITEKKLLEEKFLQVQRLESIGMLAAGIAHDLNNVLAPIVFAGPLLRASLSTPRDLKILDTLEKSAGRGSSLVKQILGFAHSTTGEFRSTQVKHLARDIIDIIAETFPKSIELQQNVPSNLWPVEGNATQIHQVLLNLCVNARDAMPRGGTLRLVAANRRLDAAEAATKPGARPGPWLMLEIGDTGVGIPPKVLEQVWTPFFTTKAAGKGTGLGLSTVRSIVLSHRGFVELDTEVGRGSTFRVFLPAVESETSGTDVTPPSEIPRGRGELILVVDDDAAILRIACQILELHGYRSVGCTDGVEAITLLNSRAAEISLVITDVDMPRIGGLAVARAARQMGHGVPLIAMSGLSRGDADGSDTVEIQKLADAFLHKPFQADDLLGTVHRLLQPSE